MIETRLTAARRDLLDLGLRNPLLNFRPLRARGVAIIDENPVHLYRLLVENGRSLLFQPLDAPADSHTPPDLSQPTTPDDPEAHFRDNKLQTPYTSTELQARLLATYDAAREYQEEQGLNVLFLALGMLHWGETTSDLHHAPLLLLPVELTRHTVTTRFRLRYTGGDLGDNLPLRARLAQDFHLTLPPLPDSDTLDLTTYFQTVQEAIRPFTGWQVAETAVTLGFFSFNKFLMLHDLTPANWPPDASPLHHPILRALLTDTGFPPVTRLADDAPIDNHLPLTHSHAVLDADSSQTLAILDVTQGHNLVIQGPPGTGKSQTIANLIAEALGRGQTVLFVAEKMAALDVVKRRLDQAGLGDACLELHSHKATKRSLLDELGRTLRQGLPRPIAGRTDNFPHLTTLQARRDQLNAASHALNTPIAQSGLSLYDVYGLLLQLQTRLAHTAPPTLSDVPWRTWSAADFATRLSLVTALQAHLRQMGQPAAHPLWGSRLTEATPDLPEQIRRLAQAAQTTLTALLTAVSHLATHLGTAVGGAAPHWAASAPHMAASAPHNPATADRLLLAAQRLLSAPRLAGLDVLSDAWHTQSAAILSILAAGQRAYNGRLAYDTWLIPAAWEPGPAAANALDIRQGLMAGRSRWRRFFSRKYRRAQEQLAGLCRAAVPPEWEAQLGAIDAVLAVQSAQPLLAQADPWLRPLFGLRWFAPDPDWEDLLRAARWLIQVHDDVAQGIYGPEVLAYAARGIDKAVLETAVATLLTAQADYPPTLTALWQRLSLDEAVRFGSTPLNQADFARQSQVLAEIHAAADRLPDILTLNQMQPHLTAAGLGELAAAANHWPAAADHLPDLLRQTWYTGLLAQTAADVTGLDSPAIVVEFGQLDREFLAYNQVRLAREHGERRPRYIAGGQMGLLQAEIEKKRNNMPIRQLMIQAGYALQRLKPVFMMSPLSIAAYLPPGSVQFDLVIFDEASQVRPVEAFGAILRGQQVVVVGDSRQMPPTLFFESLLTNVEPTAVPASSPTADSGSASAAPDEPVATADPESVLDLFCARQAPQRMLRWHYRSRHESLIAVSNQAFYERRLVIFPSPDAARQDVGLRLHHLPDAVYDRGRSRTNAGEATAVAAAVLAHARTHPEWSLGVVAFSLNQRQAIRQQLEMLRRQSPDTEPFFRAHAAEPFFVKNLENVQGDERDVILISLGYGRAADGSLTLNFGPLNQVGGERRLNVLITRARQRCEIFTNLRAADIDRRRTDAPGVLALRQYLHYAETGELADLPPDAADRRVPFEDVLAAELTAAGYTVARRVGNGPMRVDLAVVAPGGNGRFQLGIECDGDNYAQVRSARDRDRIQGQVLAQLGWRIHRVWARHWWQDPAGERESLLTALTAPPPELPPPPPLPSPHDRYDPYPTLAEERPIPLYQPAALQIDLGTKSFDAFFHENEANRQRLAGWLEEIVQAEGPVHEVEVLRRLSLAAGYQALSVPEHLAARIWRYVAKRGRLVRRGEFVWPAGWERPLVRSRAQLPPVSRKFEYIAPEELGEAALLVVQDALGIAPEDIPHRVGLLFGFRQVGASSKEVIMRQVAQLVQNGRLRSHNGQLFLRL